MHLYYIRYFCMNGGKVCYHALGVINDLVVVIAASVISPQLGFDGKIQIVFEVLSRIGIDANISGKTV